MACPSLSVPRKRAARRRTWSTAIISLSKSRSRASASRSTFIAAPPAPPTISWRATSSASSMRMASSSRWRASSFTTKRLISSSPTVISWANVPAATPKEHTATNVRSAAAPYRPRNLSTPATRSQAIRSSSVRHPIGICRSTSISLGWRSGFWRSTRSGVRTSMASARAGSTAACTPVPSRATSTGASLCPSKVLRERCSTSGSMLLLATSPIRRNSAMPILNWEAGRPGGKTLRRASSTSSARITSCSIALSSPPC